MNNAMHDDRSLRVSLAPFFSLETHRFLCSCERPNHDHLKRAIPRQWFFAANTTLAHQVTLFFPTFSLSSPCFSKCCFFRGVVLQPRRAKTQTSSKRVLHAFDRLFFSPLSSLSLIVHKKNFLCESLDLKRRKSAMGCGASQSEQQQPRSQQRDAPATAASASETPTPSAAKYELTGGADQARKAGTVVAVAFSRNGQVVVVGLTNGDLRCFGTSDWTQKWSRRVHAASVTAVVSAHKGGDDAQRFFSSGKDGAIIGSDCVTGKELFSIAAHQLPANCVISCRDDNCLVSGSSDKTVGIWDLRTKKRTAVITGHKTAVWSVAVSRDNKHILSGGEDGCIFCSLVTPSDTEGARLVIRCSAAIHGLLVTKTGSHVMVLSKAREVLVFPSSVAFPTRDSNNSSASPTAQSTASGSKSPAAAGSLSTGGAAAGLKSEKATGGSGWSRSQAALNGKQLTVAEIAAAKQVLTPAERTLQLGDDVGQCAVLSKDGRLLYVVGSIFSVWKWETGEILHREPAPDGCILSTGSLSRTNLIFAYATKTDVVLRDCADIALPTQVRNHKGTATALALSPDRNTCASASEDTTIFLWRVATGEPVGRLVGHTSRVWGVSFSHDGKFIYSSSEDQSIRIWSLSTLKSVTVLLGHTACVWSVQTVPLASLRHSLVTCSDDGTLRLWDDCSADGWSCRRTVSLNHGCVMCCAVATAETTAVFLRGRPPSLNAGAISSSNEIDDGPDETLIACGTSDGSLVLYTVEGQELVVVPAHADVLWSVVFVADVSLPCSTSLSPLIPSSAAVNSLAACNTGAGTKHRSDALVVTGSEDKSIRVWRLSEIRNAGRLPLHTILSSSAVGSVAEIASEGALVWGCADGSLHRGLIRDLPAGGEVSRRESGDIHESSVCALAVAGNCVLSGSVDMSVRYWKRPLGLASDHRKQNDTLVFPELRRINL